MQDDREKVNRLLSAIGGCDFGVVVDRKKVLNTEK